MNVLGADSINAAAAERNNNSCLADYIGFFVAGEVQGRTVCVYIYIGWLCPPYFLIKTFALISKTLLLFFLLSRNSRGRSFFALDHLTNIRPIKIQPNKLIYHYSTSTCTYFGMEKNSLGNLYFSISFSHQVHTWAITVTHEYGTTGKSFAVKRSMYKGIDISFTRNPEVLTRSI